MEASELRIGNLVKHNNRIRKVYKSHFQSIFIDFCVPIPLTEEWLIKFGWFKENDMNYCSEKPTEFCIPMMRIVNFKPNEDKPMFMCNKNGVRLKYVHQLQNLWFSLTNKELI